MDQESLSTKEAAITSHVEVSGTLGVTARGRAREFISTAPQASFIEDDKVSHDHRIHQSTVSSSYENHFNETMNSIGEDFTQISTLALKKKFEKTVGEATPSKHIKVDLDFNHCQWAPAEDRSSKDLTGRMCETSSVLGEVNEVASASTSACAYSSLEHLPPPPPELLQGPLEVPASCYSPEPLDMTFQLKYAAHKEQYSKQRNLYELKRLYKHIHPEVRRNLERDFFSDVTEIEGSYLKNYEEVGGDVQQARCVFENSGSSPNKCLSPEREYLEWDEILKGEVQSMRWMFENRPLDSIKDDSPDEEDPAWMKKISNQEIIAGSDVKYTAWMFETQPIDALGTDSRDSAEPRDKFNELARGDVRTATWLFETQPLDTLNNIYQEDEQTNQLVCVKDPAGGDVKTARYLFETQDLDSLGYTETVDESHFLHLKSELEEIKGEVKMTTKMFETQPMCVIRGDSGRMLEITTVQREEMEKGDVKTSRWLFETQPLDLINKDPSQVKLVCGVSMEDNDQGGVNRGRWLFETKTLDTNKCEEWNVFKPRKEEIVGVDVRKHCSAFETQPMDTLKDHSNARPIHTEEIVGVNVQSARHFFETVPMESMNDRPEVGKLQKLAPPAEERGDVRHQKWVFESQPLEHIREDKKEDVRTVKLEELDKGDVLNCKEIFETADVCRLDETQRIQVEGVTRGSVKSNKDYFESTPLYAMQDNSGHYHEVKIVRREEIVKGDVTSCKWMFETRPIDQFDESINNFQIIKGISKQEVQSGDVKTAKWLFETQPLDSIKYLSDLDEEREAMEAEDIVKGDVKTCQWLFETQPMEVLYEKAEIKSETENEEIRKGDVKTCTWLFETQSLDTIGDASETIIKTCTVNQEDVRGKNVQMACFLFETENLDNITKEEGSPFKKVTEIDILSGDVSRMKYKFENQSSAIMTSTSEETMQKLKNIKSEDIQKGNVVNCTWLFENQPIDAIHEDLEEPKDTRTVTDVQGGDVDKGRFIFESLSLDKIHEQSSEEDFKQLQTVVREEIEKGDVKNYRMMFETLPLYTIRDKEGHFHEVTTVTKEDVMRGDVVGARWLFETKSLDSIKDTDEVYVIKAVTEEDIQKGDVTSARWTFETQPLDEIAEDVKVLVRTVDDIQGGDVMKNRQRFEFDESMEKCVKTVSVSEIQKGNVRTAMWMFETHTVDEIHSKGSEYSDLTTVTKEELLKGDVKQSVWLFEKQPLDTIKETEEIDIVTREEMPKADVKTTTWLFETTPFHEFNESSAEKTEIVGKSIKDTLKQLYCQQIVDSQGILIEADEIGDIRMAKYNLMNQEAPEIQKEEIIRGDLQNIMMNLLNKQETTEKGIVIDKEERGNINAIVNQLLSQEIRTNTEKEEIVRGDVREALSNLLKDKGSAKQGILIQEDEKGDVRMTVYSLLNKHEETSVGKEDIVRGNVRRTLHRLLSNPDNPGQPMRIKVGESERGNVSFYSTCIESGAMDYLKKYLQAEPEETLPEREEKENIIGGDIEETKLILRRSQQQIERTVADEDIVPGDVHNTVKVFMTEPLVSHDNVQKETIVKGDLKAALDSLTQAMNQTILVEKEEVVKGDIPTALKSLEDAQNQDKEFEKPEIVPGDIKGALESLEKSVTTKIETAIEDLVPGDVKGTLRSLQAAREAVKAVEKQEIVRGDVQNALQNLQAASTEKRTYQEQTDVQGDVKGTIQLLLGSSAPLKSERRPSIEGDVKMSIKSLYDIQEQTQIEKEEVVKGDVKGTIKCLLNVKQQSAETSANLAPAVKNLSRSIKSQSCIKKQNDTNSVTDGAFLREGSSLIAQTAVLDQTHISLQTNAKEQYARQNIVKTKNLIQLAKNDVDSTKSRNASQLYKKQTCDNKTVKCAQTQLTENKTITKKTEIKTLRTDCRNVNTSQKALVKTDKILKSEEYHPKSPPLLSESEFPLPPPPSLVAESYNQVCPTTRLAVMRQDCDLPPPPPPPPVESTRAETDHFPPPPPPPVLPMMGQDYLPPPPSQLELDFMPSQVPHHSPKKVKNFANQVTAPPVLKVSKLEPPMRLEKGRRSHTLPQPPSSEKTLQRETQLISTVSSSTPGGETAKELCKPREVLKTELQTISTKLSSAEVPSGIPLPRSRDEPTHSPKKSLIPLPAPAVDIPPQKSKPYVRKFKTPLMIAEERYRKQREESERSKGAPTSVSSPSVGEVQTSVNLAFQEVAPEEKSMEQSEKGITFEALQKNPKNTETEEILGTSLLNSLRTGRSKIPSTEPLISAVSQSATAERSVQHNASKQISLVSSIQHHTKSISCAQHESTKKQVTSVSIAQPKSASDTKFQPRAIVIPSVGAEQLESVLKTSSEGDQAEHDFVHKFKNLSSQPYPSVTAQDTPQSLGKVSPQPTITKGTENVKGKILTVTEVEKIEHRGQKKGDKQGRSAETMSSHQLSENNTKDISHVCGMNVVQISTEVTGSSIQKHTQTGINVEKQKPLDDVTTAKDGAPQIQKKKSKHKSKKEKALCKETKLACSPKTNEEQGEMMMQAYPGLQSAEECGQIHQEVNITSSNVQQSFQQRDTVQLKKKVKRSQKQKDKTGNQQNKETSKDECQHVPDKMTGISLQEESAKPSEASKENVQNSDVQMLLSHINELQKTPGKIHSKMVKTLIGEVPGWLIGPEERRDLEEVAAECNTQRLRDVIVYVRNLIQAKLARSDKYRKVATMENLDIEFIAEEKIKCESTTTISNLSDSQTQLQDTTASLFHGASLSSTQHNVKIPEKTSELVEHSPAFHQQNNIQMPAAEPIQTPETFLEVSSVKDKREFFEEAQRAEVNMNYARKDPIDIPERLGPDTEDTETEFPKKEEEPLPRVDLSELLHRFESPEQKVYVRKEPIFIEERLGSDPEDVDTEGDKKSTQAEEMITFDIKAVKSVFETAEKSSHVNNEKQIENNESELSKIWTDRSKQLPPCSQQKDIKHSSPSPIQKELIREEPRVNLLELVHKFESPEPKVYVRKEPIFIEERLGSDPEDVDTEGDKKSTQAEEMITFDIKAVKSVFEEAEQSSDLNKCNNLKAERNEIMTDAHSASTLQKIQMQEELMESMEFFDAASFCEQFSSVDQFDNKAIELRSATSVSRSSGSFTAGHNPLLYADVVKRKASELGGLADGVTCDKQLKNIRQVSTVSESVSKTVCCSASEERTSQTESRLEETAETEVSSVRDFHSLPKGSLSDEVFDGRQGSNP